VAARAGLSIQRGSLGNEPRFERGTGGTGMLLMTTGFSVITGRRRSTRATMTPTITKNRYLPDFSHCISSA
jgi:hypothetical protein